uniref:Peptidase S8/S53 domain-containing protein n=1 Tax=candidate division CPR3 bacterium TaxID=2268181 RepID=A0A7C4QX15_UNCC3
MKKTTNLLILFFFFVSFLLPFSNVSANYQETPESKKSFILKTENLHQTEEKLKKIGLSDFKKIDSLNSFIVDLDEKEKSLISQDNSLIYLEENKKIKISEIPNDTYFSNQTYLQSSNILKSWDINTGSQDIVVAVIDTGVNYLHEDLKDSIWTNKLGYHGYDFVNFDNDPMDDNGHGTSIAGIIAAKRNNSLGITGIANVKIMPVKAVPYTGEGVVADLAMAIIYAADNGARIANVSLGLAEESNVLSEAINYAKNKNCLIVAATGNMNRNFIDNPARNPSVIGVTAINENEIRASYANYGLGTSLTAPGNRIFTTAFEKRSSSSFYGYSTGTSFATPQVTASVALLVSQDPSLNIEQLKKRMEASAKKISAMGGVDYDIEYGYGKLDTYNALVFDKLPPDIISTIHNTGDGNYYLNIQSIDNKTPTNIMPDVPISNIRSLKYKVDDEVIWNELLTKPTLKAEFIQNIGKLSNDKEHVITIESTDTANNKKTITLNSKDALLPTASSSIQDYRYELIEQSPYLKTTPNQTHSLKLTFKNTGSTIWNKNTVKLGTSNPKDRGSLFKTDKWLSPNRVSMKEDYVPIGGLANFEFTILTPNKIGNYSEYFCLVADGIGWMKDIGVYWKIDIENLSYHAQYIDQSPYLNIKQDENATLWVEYKNIGTATWLKDTVKLGTSKPLDRESVFHHKSSDGGWLSYNRISMDQDSVNPGEIARFSFTVTPPKIPGIYYEYFRPVADGITWMKDYGLFWQIVVD